MNIGADRKITFGGKTDNASIPAFLVSPLLAEAERRADAEREAARRAAFRPSAWLLGTEPLPTQTTVCGMTGGAERWLRIPLDLSLPPVTFAAQAHAVARQTKVVPFHGAATGFVVNYTTDDAVRFDLRGEPVAVLDGEYRPGQVMLMGGREMLAEEFARVVGITAAT
jgi:hypothetical protein